MISLHYHVDISVVFQLIYIHVKKEITFVDTLIYFLGNSSKKMFSCNLLEVV